MLCLRDREFAARIVSAMVGIAGSAAIILGMVMTYRTPRVPPSTGIPKVVAKDPSVATNVVKDLAHGSLDEAVAGLTQMGYSNIVSVILAERGDWWAVVLATNDSNRVSVRVQKQRPLVTELEREL